MMDDVVEFKNDDQLMVEFKKKVEEYRLFKAQVAAKESSLMRDRRVVQDRIEKRFEEVFEGDLKLIVGLRDRVRVLSSLDDRKAKVLEVFNGIFENMTSKTIVVAPKKDVKDDQGYSKTLREVTIGTYGFGIRKSEVSRQVKSVSEIVEVVARRDEIMSEMNKHRYLWKWADKFERFCSLFTKERVAALDVDHLSVKLDSPLVIQRYDYTGTFARIDLRMQYNYGESLNFVKFVPDAASQNSVRDAASQNSVRFDQLRSEEQSIVYMQLRDELLRRRSEFEELVNAAIVGAEQLSILIRESFGAELLMMEL